MAVIDFYSDLQEAIAQELSKLGHPPKPGENLDTILIRYLSLKRRIPPAIEWIVNPSQELQSKQLSTKIQSGLQQFIRKAESGQSLKPYLSTRITDPDYQDLMFHDWAVFHFHLGTKPHQKHQGFAERTGDLLFAIANPRTAKMYLINILPHKGGFTNQDLLKIIDTNWPEILEPHTIKGGKGLTYNASDDDIDKLRKAGANTLLETSSGRILVPMGGGLTTARTSAQSRIEANIVRSSLYQLQESIIQQQDTLETYFRNKYGKNWDELKFQIKSFRTPTKIEELTTGEEIQGLADCIREIANTLKLD